MQRCLMAIRRNQAHAQVESARGAGRRPPPRSPPRGALNRFFTILCMLQYVQAPSPRGRGRDSAARSWVRPLPSGPGRPESGWWGETGAAGGRARTQTCGVGVGVVGTGAGIGARAARAEAGAEADTFRDASNK